MAFSISLRNWCLLALLCVSAAICKSDPLDVVGEAEQCFDDGRFGNRNPEIPAFLNSAVQLFQCTHLETASFSVHTSRNNLMAGFRKAEISGYCSHVKDRSRFGSKLMRIYTCCEDEYRLSIAGILNVPPQAAEAFCDGPCLTETQLVLSCVEDEMNTFRFQNGAMVSDVRYAFQRGCSDSSKRGDFNVGEPHGPDEYSDYYGHANMLTSPLYFYFFLICALLLWGF